MKPKSSLGALDISPNTTRRLLAVHRWCGVIVSLNLAILALTGLVLVFRHEIDAASGVTPVAADETPQVPLARAVDLARETDPKANAVYLFQDAEEFPGISFVGLSRTSRRFDDAKPVAISSASGRVLEHFDLDGSFTNAVLKLHSELFAGPVGKLLVGLVALAWLTSLVTGAIVYGPLMRRFSFGLLRAGRSRRTLLADLHKLLGAVTFGWNAVVAATGLMLSLGSPLIQLYSMTELAALGAPFKGRPVITDVATLDRAVASAERQAPGRAWSIVALPGSDLASPVHYTVLLKGGVGVEAHMLTMALVDAAQPGSASIHPLPWYLKALLLSEPLHFGDYGGMPLKLLWALFGLTTLALSGSGVWVFFSARRQHAARDRNDVIDTEEVRSSALEGTLQ